MQVLKIDHLGIAVDSIDQGKNFWTDVLGLEFAGDETVDEQKVTTAFFPRWRKRGRTSGVHRTGRAGREVYRKERSRLPARCLSSAKHRRGAGRIKSKEHSPDRRTTTYWRGRCTHRVPSSQSNGWNLGRIMRAFIAVVITARV